MQNVADKCFLGLALSQTIDDLKLQKQKEIIMDIYRNVFIKKFDQRQKQFSFATSVKSEFLVENQYPIESSGKNDKNEKQYYRAILYRPNFAHHKTTDILKGKQFALVQGYSTNEEPKRKSSNKKREVKQKSGAPRKITKKN